MHTLIPLDNAISNAEHLRRCASCESGLRSKTYRGGILSRNFHSILVSRDLANVSRDWEREVKEEVEGNPGYMIDEVSKTRSNARICVSLATDPFHG